MFRYPGQSHYHECANQPLAYHINVNFISHCFDSVRLKVVTFRTVILPCIDSVTAPVSVRKHHIRSVMEWLMALCHAISLFQMGYITLVQKGGIALYHFIIMDIEPVVGNSPMWWWHIVLYHLSGVDLSLWQCTVMAWSV